MQRRPARLREEVSGPWVRPPFYDQRSRFRTPVSGLPSGARRTAWSPAPRRGGRFLFRCCGRFSRTARIRRGLEEVYSGRRALRRSSVRRGDPGARDREADRPPAGPCPGGAAAPARGGPRPGSRVHQFRRVLRFPQRTGRGGGADRREARLRRRHLRPEALERPRNADRARAGWGVHGRTAAQPAWGALGRRRGRKRRRRGGGPGFGLQGRTAVAAGRPCHQRRPRRVPYLRT
ncbi:MAG: hypothetical protein BWZ02_03330 [Lentisphaerae bacterium ADurb.BinA184]|nr:MAG: hypothetical protein BWZ02_03330 [Lentisphaerae bacterium ADurb.BinA184]